MSDAIGPDRWRVLEPLLDQALDLSADALEPFLERIGAEDFPLRADLERLLSGARSPELDRLQETTERLRADAVSSAPPPRVGRYQIDTLIGRGGMGEVFLAHDPTLDRPVALKLLPIWLEADSPEMTLLLEEARIASGLDHPNVGTIHDAGRTDGGRVYVAMTHYEGRTLQEHLADGPVGWEQAVEWAIQAARGLAEVHGRGIVHRDIKPANLMITDQRVLKILDFGIAVAGPEARGSGVVGTVLYSSPEQASAGAVDARSDVWSLGVVLYEMLSGRTPFAGGDARAVMGRILREEPPPLSRLAPHAPAWLVSVVDGCLRKDPADRYEDASALLDRFEAGRAAERRRSERRRRWSIGAATAALLLTVAVGLQQLRAPGAAGLVTSVAVFPPVPIEPDPALEALGRRLAVTVAANLDGLGDLTTAEPTSVLAQLPPSAAMDVEAQASAARRLGAGAFVGGSVIPDGTGVRLDLAVHDAVSSGVVARATVLGDSSDLAALTDSVTLALLRPLWGGTELPVPNLGAITTRSVPALRAYVDGEYAFANADWPAAVDAFQRAIAADSTFWMAHWRSVYPSSYEGGEGSGTSWRTAIEHVDELRGPDRGLVELRLTESASEWLRGAEALVARYPTYWPAWFDLGNHLVHSGPYLGRRVSESRAPLERVVGLSPRFLPAHEHLLWITILEGDLPAAVDRLDRLMALFDASPRSIPSAPYYPLLREILANGGAVTGEAVGLADALLAASPVPEAVSTLLLTYGLPVSQTALADSLLAREPRRAIAAALSMGRALSLATRGDWESAMPPAARALEWAVDPAYPTLIAGFVAAGAATGALEPDRARPLLALARARFDADDPEQAAEAAWLDGLIAFSNGDEAAAREAAARAKTSGASIAIDMGGSLDALAQALAGDLDGAATALEAIEREHAERGTYNVYGFTHPFFNSVNRVLAGRWLLESDDALRAEALVSWDESVLWELQGPLGPANKVFSPLASQLRGAIAEATGRRARARESYEAFLRLYDRASGLNAGRRDEVRAALERLGS